MLRPLRHALPHVVLAGVRWMSTCGAGGLSALDTRGCSDGRWAGAGCGPSGDARFRRLGDGWKVTHEHASVPFYMDGAGRPAFDLRP